jgi:SAM-dependent methyltransferase
VRVLLERLNLAEAEIKAVAGLPLDNQRILEIGPGQRFRQMQVLARKNDVLGIDLDELLEGFSLRGYMQMLRANGPVRVVKTAGRKLIGIDRKFSRELDRQTNTPAPKRLKLRQMDATRMDLPDNSFDIAYSYSVFEHIPDCRAVLREIKRVLRPGGAAHISLHLYTSDSGCHDPRIFSGRRGELPLWPHLRPQWQEKVQPNAYLNKIRLADWTKLFAEEWPGVVIHTRQYGRQRLIPEIAKLRNAGELADYTDDELVTVDYVAVWKKPAD